jgi:hypothetical protein
VEASGATHPHLWMDGGGGGGEGGGKGEGEEGGREGRGREGRGGGGVRGERMKQSIIPFQNRSGVQWTLSEAFC